MHFAQHYILSWFAGETAGLERLSERRIVTWAGVLPDADVIPYGLATAYYWLAQGMSVSDAWHTAFDQVHRAVHHHYTHGIAFAALTALAAYALCACLNRRDVVSHAAAAALHPPAKPTRTALLAGGAVILHMLCDVLASGPRWPVYPWWPFSGAAWGYADSWNLDDWRNILTLITLLIVTRQYAKWKGRSPVEAASARLDRAFVRLVRGQVGSEEK